MVQTRRGTHASPEPQQSTTRQERSQSRDRDLSNSLKANSKSGKKVPKEMMALLEDETDLSEAVEPEDDLNDEEEDEDHVSINLDIVNNGIQGSLTVAEAEAEGPDAQLHREASERPQSAEVDNDHQDAISYRGQSTAAEPRVRKTRRGPKKVSRLSKLEDDLVKSAASRQQLPPGGLVLHSESNQAHSVDAGESHFPAPPEEAVRTLAPDIGSYQVEEGMFLDEDEDDEIVDFPKLPARGFKDFMINMKAGGLAGMLKVMGKAGCTGLGSRWEAELRDEVNRNLVTPHSPHTKLCRSFWYAAHRVVTIFQEASSHDSPSTQHQFLTHKTEEIDKVFSELDKYITGICDKKLAKPPSFGEQLLEKQLKSRLEFTEDALRYCISATVIVLRETFKFGEPEDVTRARSNGRFTGVGLGFLIQEMQWLLRLVRTVDRELRERPFEPEFLIGADELNEAESLTRKQKSKTREEFRNRLTDFRDSLFAAIEELHSKHHEEERRKQDDEDRRQRAELAQRHEHEARKREHQEKAAKKKQHASQWQAFVTSTQTLGTKPDPVKRKWDEAIGEEQVLRERVAARSSQASQQWAAMVASTHNLRDMSDPVESRWIRGTQRSTHPLAQEDDDPSGDGLDQEQRQTGPNRDIIPAWPDWRADEDKVLFEAIKYSRALNIPRVAEKLNRDEHDVKQHLQELRDARARA